MSISRRTVLAGLAAGTTAATSAAAAGHLPADPTDAALIDLGRQLDAATARRDAAEAARLTARRHFDSIAPTPPEALRKVPGHSIDIHATMPAHVEDAIRAELVEEPGTRVERMPFYTSAALRSSAGCYSPRTRTGKLARQLLPVAEEHEAALSAAVLLSGLREAVAEEVAARAAVDAIAKRIHIATATGRDGLVVKARAIMAGDPIVGGLLGGAALARDLLATVA